jgi:hypothetical protein
MLSYSVKAFRIPLLWQDTAINRLWLRPVYTGCNKHNDSVSAFLEGFKFVAGIPISVRIRFKFVLYS